MKSVDGSIRSLPSGAFRLPGAVPTVPTVPAALARRGAPSLPGLAAARPARPAGPADLADLADCADPGPPLGLTDGELAPEVRTVLDLLTREVRSLRQDLERTRKRARDLEMLADQDALTPGLNRRAFLRELTRMLAFAERYRAPSSLVYLDLNEMKRINDGFGHGAGDAVLRHVAAVLVENVRPFDVVGRLGGDEFAVILAQVDGVRAVAKARSLAESIEGRPAGWNGCELVVRVAFGVYTFAGGERVDEVLHAADRAMYERKKAARTPRAAA